MKRTSIESLEPRTQLAVTPLGSMPSSYTPVDFEVGNLAADPKLNRVYLIDLTDDDVRVFDTDKGKQVGTIPLRNPDPTFISVSPDGTTLVLGSSGTQTLEVVSLASLTSVRTLPIGFYPSSLVVGTGGKVYVSGSGIVAFDYTTGVRGRSIDLYSSDVALEADLSGKRLYVCDGNYVTEYDITKPSQFNDDELRFFYTGTNSSAALVDRTANRIFTWPGGLQSIDMGTKKSCYIPLDGNDEFAENVATVEGMSDFFVRSDDATLFQVNKATGKKRYRYAIGGVDYIHNGLVATPNGRVMYVSTFNGNEEMGFGVGIIGTSSLKISSVKTTVSGVEFFDRDRDGKRGADETDITNAYIYLDLDNDGTRDQISRGDAVDEPSALIAQSGASDGSYLFKLPAAGTYTLRVDREPAFGDGNVALVTKEPALTFTVAEGQQVRLDVPTAYAGFTELSFFLDLDADGKRDANEHSGGRPDVYLDLNKNGKPDADEPVRRWTSDYNDSFGTTDLYTDYLYFAALPGTYDVRTLPSSHALTTRPATRVTIVENTGTRFKVGVASTRYVSGKLFHDVDADGRRDSKETGYGGVAVWLDLDEDGRRDSNEPAARTKLNGSYQIISASPVNNAPIRFANEFARLISTAHRKRVTLTNGVTSITANAGVYLPPMIVVTAFTDADHDGKRDANEKGRVGVPVFIDLNVDNKQDKNEPATITDANGRATFADLSPGQYLVRARLSEKVGTTTSTSELLTVQADAATVLSIGLR